MRVRDFSKLVKNYVNRPSYCKFLLVNIFKLVVATKEKIKIDIPYKKRAWTVQKKN